MYFTPETILHLHQDRQHRYEAEAAHAALVRTLRRPTLRSRRQWSVRRRAPVRRADEAAAGNP